MGARKWTPVPVPFDSVDLVVSALPFYRDPLAHKIVGASRMVGETSIFACASATMGEGTGSLSGRDGGFATASGT